MMGTSCFSARKFSPYVAMKGVLLHVWDVLSGMLLTGGMSVAMLFTMNMSQPNIYGTAAQP